MLEKGAQLDRAARVDAFHAQGHAPGARGRIGVGQGFEDPAVGVGAHHRAHRGVCGQVVQRRTGEVEHVLGLARLFADAQLGVAVAAAALGDPGGRGALWRVALPGQLVGVLKGFAGRGQGGGHPVGDDVVVGFVGRIQLHQLHPKLNLGDHQK